ncbi:MAG: MurR/RpiR family transcriptional regulator [Lawsonibacter sp.]|jgi:DNA-binding MurR/RpiR family transcriptional regulator
MKELFQTIQGSYESLSQAQRVVADYIVHHYKNIPFQSVTELADTIGVSDTTIIRYCMQLGFKGYGDFKKAISEYVQSHSNWYDHLERSLEEIESQDSYTKAYNQELNNLKTTVASPLNRASYQKLLEMLNQAENIYVMGFRTSAIAAQFMSLGLGQQGYRSCVLAPGAGDYQEVIFRMTPKDLLISFCFSRYAKEGIRIIQRAVEMGVPHVTFTDSQLSPSASMADAVFTCSVHSYITTPALTGVFALIDAILTGCAQYSPKKVKEHMRSMEQFLMDGGFYY